MSSYRDLSNLRTFLQLEEALLYLKAKYCSIGKNFFKVFQNKNCLEINTHDDFSTVNGGVAVLVYLV